MCSLLASPKWLHVCHTWRTHPESYGQPHSTIRAQPTSAMAAGASQSSALTQAQSILHHLALGVLQVLLHHQGHSLRQAGQHHTLAHSTCSECTERRHCLCYAVPCHVTLLGYPRHHVCSIELWPCAPVRRCRKDCCNAMYIWSGHCVPIDTGTQ